MANETLGAVRLRTKITGSDVQDSELLTQEIAFGNTEQVLYVKDYSEIVHQYLRADDTAATSTNCWSAEKIEAEIAVGTRGTVYDDIWSEGEQLAIDPIYKGDVVVRQDIARSYMQNGGSAGTMDDWSEILTPASVSGTVVSINGLQGIVVLTTAQVPEDPGFLYYTEARVSANADVAAATAIVPYVDQDVTVGAAPTLDGSNITNLSISNADTITVEARKATPGTIPAGRPVFFVSKNVGGWYEVEEAYSTDPFRMGAIGLTEGVLTDTATGNIVTAGILQNVNTSSFSSREELYVGGFGGLTNVRPTNGNIIQVIAQALESDISGSVLILNSGLPKNDLPRLEDGYVWQGDVNNAPTAIDLNAFIDNYATTYTGSTTITTVGTITTGTWAAGTIDGGTF